ncbi:MAG: D-alanyl-D-alanine dipeptidase [Clostridiaceae bacterium]|nr:D-alanyl-D-alanine dipeptidase [Clostridiaceae bacterium]
MDIAKKIIYFILVLMLIVSNSACYRQKDKLINTETDILVPVNAEIESSDIRNDVDTGVNNNENGSDKKVDTEESDNKVDKDTSAEENENKTDKDTSGEGNENKNDNDIDTQESEGKSDKNADTREREDISEKDIGTENSQNGSDKETVGKNDEIDQNTVVEKQGLVELIKLDNSFIIDIKYATEDNFAKKKIYSMPLCLINKNTAKKLIAANNEFKTLGYRIKVFDAYRPQSAQQVLWDSTEDKSYLANPKKGSKHNRGAAVDVTLVDEEGNELRMPSGYDEFSERAHLKFNKCEEELIKNRELLGEIMIKHGFKRISTEWWHFDDTDALKYPLLDIAFEEFLQ